MQFHSVADDLITVRRGLLPVFSALAAMRGYGIVLQMTIRALFFCSKNKLRSPSAEAHFSCWNGVECDSAGTADDAVVPIMPEQIAWATVIFVMEKAHLRRLRSRFSQHLHNKRVICLGAPEIMHTCNLA